MPASLHDSDSESGSEEDTAKSNQMKKKALANLWRRPETKKKKQAGAGTAADTAARTKKQPPPPVPKAKVKVSDNVPLMSMYALLLSNSFSENKAFL